MVPYRFGLGCQKPLVQRPAAHQVVAMVTMGTGPLLGNYQWLSASWSPLTNILYIVYMGHIWHIWHIHTHHADWFLLGLGFVP